ncbi:MAG TPA: mechanosensitive ion channel domain-containing protein [Candidatus Limnocylindrales bacterium]|nr:mechanosensitive ion channel domain-containing protein [Candidatus Limnocylindrales bacterium]
MTADTLIAWVSTNAIALLVGLIVLVVIYRFALPLMHRFVLAVLRAQQVTLEQGGAPADEVRKRAATLEDVLARLIKLGVFALLIMLILSVFDLWPMLAGLGLIAAALTIAGQAIILDYLMGILILAEGQYFKGDWISVDVPNGVLEGEVEEVGLRRTVLRDARGVHSVSNGLIRASSNSTRIFSQLTVEVRILRAGQIDQAIEVVNSVGEEMAADPAWKGQLLEAPRFLYVVELGLDGAVLRLRGKVKPGQQWLAASDLRRRLATSLAAKDIDTARWDTAAMAGAGLVATANPTKEPGGNAP